MKNTSFEIQQS